jgi:predicted nuclease with TOPRIM domain
MSEVNVDELKAELFMIREVVCSLEDKVNEKSIKISTLEAETRRLNGQIVTLKDEYYRLSAVVNYYHTEK